MSIRILISRTYVLEPTTRVVVKTTLSTTTSVYIEWLQLELDLSQCPVITYEVKYTYENCSTGRLEETVFNTTELSQNITQLQPYWNYTFTVAAYTDAGKGGSDSESVTILTFQTGRCRRFTSWSIW